MKKILITGAASGLGRGLALAFAQAGHTIYAADLDLPGARETAAQFGGAAFALDVASPTSVAQCIESIGPQNIDVLINNAGLQHVAKVEEFPIEKWQLLMRVMVDG